MLSGFIGNGTGVLIIGVCMIVMRHLKPSGGGAAAGPGRGGGMPVGGGKAHHDWRQWTMRVVIFFMFCGATALSVVGIGNLFRSAAQGLLTSIAGANGAFIIATLIGLFLMAEVAVLWWVKPSRKVAWSAVVLAFALLLTSSGPIGRLGNQLHQVGTQYSTQFDAWMRS